MFQITCPWCGPRAEIEFLPRDEVTRRPDPATASDAVWTAYLYQRSNPRGWSHEYWQHVHGCMQLFAIRRHTVTHETADG
jgi:sarcosine oxidase subunit delta